MEDTISPLMSEVNTEVNPPQDGHEAEPLPLSQEILDVFAKLGENATIGDLIHQISHRGFGFLLVVLSVPPALPGTSGIATPFGILIFLLALQMVAGRDEPWLPQGILKRNLGKSLRAMLNGAAGLLRKFEKLLHPRASWLFHKAPFRFLVSPLMVLCGISIAIPLPGTNSVAGIAVLLVGLGMLEEDGYFGMGGVAIALAGITLAVISVWFVVMYGPKGIEMLQNMIRGTSLVSL